MASSAYREGVGRGCVAFRIAIVLVVASGLGVGLPRVTDALAIAEGPGTRLHIDADQRGPVGHAGRDFTLSNAGFTARAVPGAVEVLVDGPGTDDWGVRVEAPDGEALVPGPYRQAQKAGVGSPTRPGLGVFGPDRKCEWLTGEFEILELLVLPDGTVGRFAADFEQQCGGDPVEPTVGEIRLNASTTFALPPDGDADGVPNSADLCPAAVDALQADADHDGVGDACDPIHETTSLLITQPAPSPATGEPLVLRPEDGTFTVTEEGEQIRVEVDAGPSSWRVDLAAPPGARLAPGAYERATRAGQQPTGVPGIEMLARDNGRCPRALGRFEVLELVRGSGGVIQRFAADAQLRCGEEAMVQHISVRFDADDDLQEFPDRDEDGISDVVDVCDGIADAAQVDIDADGVGDACDPLLDVSLLTWEQGGAGGTVTQLDGRFSVAGTPDRVQVTIDLGNDVLDDWRLDFRSGGPRPLVVGPYESQRESSFGTPLQPLVWITKHQQPSSCANGYQQAASFDVLQIAYAPDGTVRRFSADFSVACNTFHEPIRGSLRFNAPLGLAPADPPDTDQDLVPDSQDDCPATADTLQTDLDRDGVGDACDTRVEDTRVTRREPPGDLNAPEVETWYADEVAIDVFHTEAALWVSMHGARYELEFSHFIGGPRRLPLVAGRTYTGPFRASSIPGREPLFAGSPTCLQPARFVVHELELDEDGEVARLSYDEWCDGLLLPSLEFRYNASAVPAATPIVRRVAGDDRITTAIAAAEDTFHIRGTTKAFAREAVLARADDFADALAATPYAADHDAPLLLTGRTTLDPRTKDAIRRMVTPWGRITIVGGPAAVNPAIELELRGMGYEVERLAGADRFETAVAIAVRSTRILLVTGRGFPDGLAAGAAAAHDGRSILLTDGDRLPEATVAYLQRWGGTDVMAVGGPAARAAPWAPSLAGADRYETARILAEHFFGSAPQSIGLASGETFPDALSGGTHIANRDGPLLLTRKGTLPASVRQYLATRDQHETVVYGGAAAVDPSIPGPPS
jgi:hypothetical protein